MLRKLTGRGQAVQVMAYLRVNAEATDPAAVTITLV